MIVIDGSMGEGGGQILRTSLSLSLITGQPFRLENIRAKRKRTGLLEQHLTAANAAAAIGGAEIQGAQLNSSWLEFRPGPVRPGHYHFTIRTAGSVMLVLQTLLLPLALAPQSSTLVLEGGTHNPFAPPFDYLEKTWLPLARRMGLKASLKLDRHGFYPAGGGKVRVAIEPIPQLHPIEIRERGEMVGHTVRVLLANLPELIAEREIRTIHQRTGWRRDCFRTELIANSRGPGNVVFIELELPDLTEIVTGFGERGVRAEVVAGKALEAALGFIDSDVAVGPYLADQLLLPLALARGGGYLTGPLSAHSQTNMETIRLFLGAAPVVQPAGEGKVLVNF